jgi:hypothetical protein
MCSTKPHGSSIWPQSRHDPQTIEAKTLAVVQIVDQSPRGAGVGGVLPNPVKDPGLHKHLMLPHQLFAVHLTQPLECDITTPEKPHTAATHTQPAGQQHNTTNTTTHASRLLLLLLLLLMLVWGCPPACDRHASIQCCRPAL